MPIELQDKLYTSAQVADILGVSLRTLYRYMEDGRIQSMRTASGRHRFTKEQIVEFLEAGNYEPEVTPQYGDAGRVAQDRSTYSGDFNAPVRQTPSPKVDLPELEGEFDSDSSDDFYDNNRGGSGAFGSKRQPADYGQTPWGNQPQGASRDFEFKSQGSSFRNQSDDAFSSFGGRTKTNAPQPGSQQFGNDFRPKPTIPSDNVVLDDRFDAEDDGSDDDFTFDTKAFMPSAPAQPGRANPGIGGSGMPNRYGQDLTRNSRLSGDSRPAYQPTAPQNRPADEDFRAGHVTPARNDSLHAAPPRQNMSHATEERAPDVGSLSVRFYKSEYNDLIELAKKIKEVAINRDLEYAFTLNAGLSLHFLINPFTVLHFYINPEDMQLWRNELMLTPARDASEANIGILINSDVVFMPTREIGGFRVVDDKILLKDLMKTRDEELIKKFRQHLIGS